MKQKEDSLGLLLKHFITQDVASYMVVNTVTPKHLNDDIVSPKNHQLVLSERACLVVNALIDLLLSRLVIFIIKVNDEQIIRHGQCVLQGIQEDINSQHLKVGVEYTLIIFVVNYHCMFGDTLDSVGPLNVEHSGIEAEDENKAEAYSDEVPSDMLPFHLLIVMLLIRVWRNDHNIVCSNGGTLSLVNRHFLSLDWLLRWLLHSWIPF